MRFGRSNRPLTCAAILLAGGLTGIVGATAGAALNGRQDAAATTRRAEPVSLVQTPAEGSQAASGPVALDLSAPVPYFIGSGAPEEGFRRTDRQLAQWALQAWQRAIGPGLRLTPAPESSAVVRLYWAGPDGGQYGEMRSLSVAGRRGAAVFIRPDTSSLGPELAALAQDDPLLRDTIVYLTCLHELGHAFGLRHTSDVRDIMYSFGFGGDIVEYFGRYRRHLRARGDIAATSALSDGDLDRLRALYPAQ